MAFTDEDLKRLRGNLSRYGIDPGIDVCNYFDYASEIAGLLTRLEAAEKVIGSYAEHYSPEHVVGLRDLFNAWRKAAGK